MRVFTLFCPLFALMFFIGCHFIGCQGAQAASYSYVINGEGWQVETSVLACRMSSLIPFYGEAVFHQRAGVGKNEFLLKPRPGNRVKGRAVMMAKAPIWHPGAGTTRLGYITLQRDINAIVLDKPLARQVIAQLRQGREIILAREEVRLTITNIAFRKAYKTYLDCLANMLPANFDQIKRTAIYFEPGGYKELPPGGVEKLHNILLYAETDPHLATLYIDGHTDGTGRLAANLALSKKRAQLVTNYLTKRGMPKERIVMRWHGERYPVGSNDNPKTRAANRRVTIRLERIERIEIPTLASSTPDIE